MLVVTRKVGEKVMIPGKGIEVMVVKVLPNGAVRIGVKAPDGVAIYREELLCTKKR
jgi:carbon storage regulator CsrA